MNLLEQHLYDNYGSAEYMQGAPSQDAQVAMIANANPPNFNLKHPSMDTRIDPTRIKQLESESPYFGEDYAVKHADITYSIDIGGQSGKLPDEALMAKFDETNIDDDEMIQDKFHRETLKDRRPDTATFAYEEPRKSIGNKGYLNLLHYGGRGSENFPAHPEIFIEEVAREPRRTFTDPDFNELRLQQDARMRFVKWGSGNDDRSITGGYIREDQMRDLKKQTMKLIQPRLKIFSTSKDGRRNGLWKAWQHRAASKGATKDQAYQDFIKELARNPQRKTTLISNEVIRATKWYFQNTADHEFEVARYGEDPRRMEINTTQNKVRTFDNQQIWCECDQNQNRRFVGILMGNLICQKQKIEDQMARPDANEAQIRKLAKIAGDLEKVLFMISHDTEFYDQDGAQNRKSVGPKLAAHNARVTQEDSAKPAHLYHNANLMYKSVSPAADVGKIKNQIQTDENKPTDFAQQDRKTGVLKAKTGKRNSEITVDGKSLSLPSYKSSKKSITSQTKRNLREDADRIESDNTQTRRTPHGSIDVTNPRDLIQMIGLGDNDAATRWGGGGGFRAGGKLKVRRYSDRESSQMETTDMIDKSEANRE